MNDIFNSGLLYIYRDKRKPRMARALYLRIRYDMKFREIAEELGCSVQNARQLYYKGEYMFRRYLRTQLGIKKLEDAF